MKRIVKWILLGLLALLVCGAIGVYFYTRSQTEVLHATVINHLAKPEAGPDAPPPIRIFFVQIDGHDPPPALVERFKQVSISLRPISQGVLTPGPYSGHMKDIKTGESGMELNFRRIVWLGLSRPVVHTSRNLYGMTRENGEWRVEYVAMRGG